jgi:DNA-binding NtrC family response regulator
MKMPLDLNGTTKKSLKIACRSEATVLITGPTGSGKTCLARRIHDESARRGKPFITVNLASLHEGTIESELFGHERGAFTGADSRRVGRLELANGGTVFLDEVGELSLRLQARLLEFLQSRTITPVGGNRESRLDVRVIAATHRNLSRAVEKGEFREDLFHRLRVISIGLKSLAERHEEFGELVHACLADACASAGRSVHRISGEVANRFESYRWPGNLRELRNVLEYAVLASDGPEILPSDLPDWFGALHDPAMMTDARLLGVAEIALTMNYQESLSKFERAYLEHALGRFRGRVNQTARNIGINKTTLIRRMRAYGLSKKEANVQ